MRCTSCDASSPGLLGTRWSTVEEVQAKKAQLDALVYPDSGIASVSEHPFRQPAHLRSWVSRISPCASSACRR